MLGVRERAFFLKKKSGKTIKKAQMDVTGGFDITFIRAQETSHSR